MEQNLGLEEVKAELESIVNLVSFEEQQAIDTFCQQFYFGE